MQPTRFALGDQRVNRESCILKRRLRFRALVELSQRKLYFREENRAGFLVGFPRVLYLEKIRKRAEQREVVLPCSDAILKTPPATFLPLFSPRVNEISG